MFGLPEIAGMAAGSGLAAALAPGGNSTSQLTDSINAILNKALTQSLTVTGQYTGQAVNQQNTSLQAAINALTGYNTSGQQQATSTMQNALAQSQQLRQPYSNMGLNAADTYAKTLGLATPKGGSVANMQAQNQAQQLLPLLQSLQGNYNPTAPTAPGAFQAPTVGMDAVTPDMVQQYIKANQGYTGKLGQSPTIYNGVGAGDAINSIGGMQASGRGGHNDIGKVMASQSQIVNKSMPAIQQLLLQQAQQQATQQAQSQYNTQQSQYQTALGNYTTQTGTIGQLNSVLQGLDPATMQLLASQLKGKL